MSNKKTVDELLSFIKKSPTAFHAIDEIRKTLKSSGFEELLEGGKFKIKNGGSYFVTRNNSSIIAVKIGKSISDYGFNITASHSDSPTFRIKENAELDVKGRYTQLNTEGYGGMLCATWFDKPLSIAGRVLVKNGDRLETRLIAIDRDLVVIPNVAIHMNRQVNDGFAYNKQIDMLPLFGEGKPEKGALKELIAKELGVSADDIYGSDLFLYNRTHQSVWGREGEYMSSPRLDNLECAYASLQGFLEGENDKTVQVYVCYDNEEVGSGTKQGAASTFLSDILARINLALGKTEEDFKRAVAKSFLLSCDNAHAVHPNHPEKTDDTNCSYMNGGIVIKSHAGQKYCSDGVSIAVFKAVCEKADVPYQFFANRSNELGGSTLGNISMSQLSMNAVDIGLAQLAMHSSYETAGVKDCDYLIKACKVFYDSSIDEIDSFNLSISYRD